MSRKYFGDVKHLPRTGSWFTEREIVLWCAGCFAMGAACAVVVMFALST